MDTSKEKPQYISRHTLNRGTNISKIYRLPFFVHEKIFILMYNGNFVMKQSTSFCKTYLLSTFYYFLFKWYIMCELSTNLYKPDRPAVKVVYRSRKRESKERFQTTCNRISLRDPDRIYSCVWSRETGNDM